MEKASFVKNIRRIQFMYLPSPISPISAAIPSHDPCLNSSIVSKKHLNECGRPNPLSEPRQAMGALTHFKSKNAPFSI